MTLTRSIPPDMKREAKLLLASNGRLCITHGAWWADGVISLLTHQPFAYPERKLTVTCTCRHNDHQRGGDIRDCPKRLWDPEGSAPSQFRFQERLEALVEHVRYHHTPLRILDPAPTEIALCVDCSRPLQQAAPAIYPDRTTTGQHPLWFQRRYLELVRKEWRIAHFRHELFWTATNLGEAFPQSPGHAAAAWVGGNPVALIMQMLPAHEHRFRYSLSQQPTPAPVVSNT
jgi:hypothetical protein